jgi:hypothetical protein
LRLSGTRRRAIIVDRSSLPAAKQPPIDRRWRLRSHAAQHHQFKRS